MSVILPICAVLNDEDHYPNANRFEPERFTDGGLKMYKDKGLYYAFGDGPRVCLGNILKINIKSLKLLLKNILYLQECVLH